MVVGGLGLGNGNRPVASPQSWGEDLLWLDTSDGVPDAAGSTGVPTAPATGGGRYFVDHDRIGSVVALTAADGHVGATYAYEPFGEERGAALPDVGVPDNRIRFADEYLEGRTDLYQLHRGRSYRDRLARTIDSP